MTLLIASNGHGEDDIAGRILDALRAQAPGLAVEGWAMVGQGNAYLRRNVPLAGPANLLPSEGFGTLSLRHFLRDLRHGFLPVYARQARFARGLRGRYRMILAVGDIVPLAAGWLSRTPTAFVSCAKSAWYGGRDGHDALDRALMRRAVAVFPRDSLTAERLAAARVPVRNLGNPMMDGLDPTDPAALIPKGTTGIAMLAGSRQDAGDNTGFLLDAAARVEGPGLRFLFAAHPSVDVAGAAQAAIASGRWYPMPPGPHLHLATATGNEAILAIDRFADMLHAASLAVGIAGTANEQAVGLGVPLIAVPGSGNQGAAFVAMKAQYFGPAAESTPRDPGAVARMIARLLADPARRAAMGAAGRLRMGPAGASAAIAAAILAEYEARA